MTPYPRANLEDVDDLLLYIFCNSVTNFSLLMGLETNGGRFTLTS